MTQSIYLKKEKDKEKMKAIKRRRITNRIEKLTIFKRIRTNLHETS
jgi:hypothetical protein